MNTVAMASASVCICLVGAAGMAIVVRRAPARNQAKRRNALPAQCSDAPLLEECFAGAGGLLGQHEAGSERVEPAVEL